MRPTVLLSLVLLLQQDTGEQFFRFKKGTCWIYEASNGDRSGKMTLTVAREEGGRVVVNWERFAAGDEKETDVESLIWQVRDGFLWLDPDDDEAVPVYKLGSKKGDTWRVAVGKENRKRTVEGTNEGTADLKVPAGTYKDVLHVSILMDAREARLQMYLAPKVGLVKLEVPDEFIAELKEIKEVKDVKEAPSASARRNERHAAAALKTLATAQAMFRSNDFDKNEVNDFWTADVSGLYRIAPDGKNPIQLIEVSAAEADAAPIDAELLAKRTAEKPKPMCGYHLRQIPKDADGKTYGQDTDGSGKNWRNNERFGVCAYPAEYGKTGTRTFIISEENTIYWKDTAGKAVEQWPKKEDLGKNWRALE